KRDNIGKVKQKRNQFRLNIEDVVQQGISAGEFKRDLRADMVTFGILGVANYSYNWYMPDGEVTPDERTAVFSNLVLSGMVADLFRSEMFHVMEGLKSIENIPTGWHF